MLSGTGKKLKMRLLISSILLLISAAGLSAQTLSLRAELKEEHIWLGESVQLALYLQGSDEAISPQLDIPGMDIVSIGGSVNNSRSVTSVNGRVTEKITKAYVCGFLLTPNKPGQFIIPPISVTVEGKQLTTRALVLDVEKPGTSDDFKLEVEFDRKQTYLHDECFLRIRFLYNSSLRNLEIKIPGLEKISGTNILPQNLSDGYKILVNGSPVIFKKDDQGGLAGVMTVYSIRPGESGELSLESSTASFERVTAYKNVQDFFGNIQRQEVYEETVIAGTPAKLNIVPFPEAGRPDDFFGLSGDISIDVSIEPVEFHVGDPVTLSLSIDGMNNTDVKIPPLSRFLGDGIDIPETRSSAKVDDRSRTITQTIRVNDASVKQIPALSFRYFNTETREYDFASSVAVAVRVLETDVVTSAELEGAAGDSDDRKIMLEKKRDGIYYNYTGDELLSADVILLDRLGSSILLRIILALPPAIYLFVLIYTRMLPQVRRRAEARADRSRALKRLGRLVRRAGGLESKSFLKEFNSELADFMRLHGKAEDESAISPITELINSVLYGREIIPPERAREAAERAVSILEKKGLRDAS